MKGSPPIEEGEGVLVDAKEGLTLVVQPDKGESSLNNPTT
jgi:hypothetical protein